MRTNAPDQNPADETRSKDPFSAVFCPTLRTALREVFAEWTPQLTIRSEGEFSLEATGMQLALLLDRSGANGVPHEVDGPPEVVDQAGVRLLTAIRRNLLEQWRVDRLGVHKERVLELLHSIDLLVEEAVDVGREDREVRLAEPAAFGLVAEVGHDLRSPLTSILFLSEALRNGRSGSVTELQKCQLGLIYSAALGLSGVANDLMTIAQEQRSGHLDEAGAFCLHETVESVREMVAPMAEAKEVSLRFGVDCSCSRVGHPGPLGRVLLNLTTNAIRFTQEGGSVVVQADPVARDEVEISVRDTGRGIPPERMARLYEPFQKCEGREGYFFAPSGLGLSIVRRLLENMGSELTIDSEVGKGTCFSFVLMLPMPH